MITADSLSESVQQPAASDGTNFQNFLVQDAAATAASTASQWVMERFEDPNWEEKIRKALSCTRLGGCFDLFCNKCEDTIAEGKYARESDFKRSVS